MTIHRVESLTDLEALAAVTALLQRIRRSHPTAGLLEAADLQWWWRRPRPSDGMPQLTWLDATGEPVAAMRIITWATRTSIDAILVPDIRPDLVAGVVDRGLAAAAAAGVDEITIDVDPDDATLQDALLRHGFAVREEGPVIEAWLEAAARAPVSPLHEGYTLLSRRQTLDRPHHLIERNGPAVEERLRQTSLYRDDLDLLVLDPNGAVAAYGLFWHDPVSATGLVEPMRTEDAHQRRGLARHVLTAGIERLVAAGAQRIKIGWEPENPASGPLYRSVGFVPFRRAVVLAGRTGGGAAG